MTPTTPRPQWFDTLLANHEGFIRRKCNFAEYASEDARDLFQDVQLRAVERWQSYKPGGSFASWINFILRGVRQDKYRKRQRQDKYPRPIPQLDTPPSQEHFVDIDNALANVTPYEAKVIYLRAVGYSGPETGAMLGMTRQAVQWGVASGQKKLRAANDNVKQNKKAG